MSIYTGIQEHTVNNCVTLSSNEVSIRASENNEWRVTFQRTKVNFLKFKFSWSLYNILH